MTLEYVKDEQTHDICLAAVNQTRLCFTICQEEYKHWKFV